MGGIKGRIKHLINSPSDRTECPSLNAPDRGGDRPRLRTGQPSPATPTDRVRPDTGSGWDWDRIRLCPAGQAGLLPVSRAGTGGQTRKGARGKLFGKARRPAPDRA